MAVYLPSVCVALQRKADQTALKNAILRREFLPAKELSKTLAGVAQAMTQTIRGSALERRAQDDLLLQSASIKVLVEGARQKADGAMPPPGAAVGPKKRRPK